VAKASNLKVNTPANQILLNSSYARVWGGMGGGLSLKNLLKYMK
jgi:hypothetical protein